MLNSFREQNPLFTPSRTNSPCKSASRAREWTHQERIKVKTSLTNIKFLLKIKIFPQQIRSVPTSKSPRLCAVGRNNCSSLRRKHKQIATLLLCLHWEIQSSYLVLKIQATIMAVLSKHLKNTKTSKILCESTYYNEILTALCAQGNSILTKNGQNCPQKLCGWCHDNSSNNFQNTNIFLFYVFCKVLKVEL